MRILSFNDTLHIHLTIIRSVLSRLGRFQPSLSMCQSQLEEDLPYVEEEKRKSKFNDLLTQNLMTTYIRYVLCYPPDREVPGSSPLQD